MATLNIHTLIRTMNVPDFIEFYIGCIETQPNFYPVLYAA